MARAKPKALVVGGSSGLGKVLTKRLLKTHSVTVTGTTERRKRGNKPKVPARCRYVQLEVKEDIESCLPLLRTLAQVPWDVIVWAAGFEREDSIELHSVEDFMLMLNVTFQAPAHLTRLALSHQKKLGQLVLVSGIVDEKVIMLQPAMAPTRCALAVFAACMSRDGRIESIVHVAPDRMRDTWYYTGTDRDTDEFARAAVVAERIHEVMTKREPFTMLNFQGEELL